MLIVRGIMWISVLIVMLICMVKTKRNGMKKKIRALIFVVFLFILFVFMPYSRILADNLQKESLVWQLWPRKMAFIGHCRNILFL